jgi:two-component system, NtrC family, sensor kinase
MERNYVSSIVSPPSSANFAEARGPASARRSHVRLNWQVKTLIPVAAALLNGVLVFIFTTLTLLPNEREKVLLVASAGAVLICAILLITLAVVVRRPIVELQDKIQQVADGDLHVEVGFSERNDDIGDLGRNFNYMVRQLRESRQEIEHLHRTQMSRAEHMATLGELAAGLAHEIRNPLAGIAGVMQIVGRDLPPSSPACDVVKDVQEEVVRINRIVSDLLETARPRPPEFQLADLNATVEHAVTFARQQVLSKPIDIELRKLPELALVEHDPRQLHQVLLNLLLNATQALDGAGRISVMVSQVDESAVSVSINDTGLGIAPENLSHIFRPFFTTKGHGTGLGLPLARRIVEEHGGKLEVTSDLGHGSTFTLVLPFRRPQPEMAASA